MHYTIHRDVISVTPYKSFFHTYLQKYIHSPCLIIRQNETAGSNSTKPMKPAD